MDEPDIDRLADSLVALGQSLHALPRFEQELAEVRDLLGRETALRRFLSDSGVRPEGKHAALVEILGADTHPALVHFLLTLLDLGIQRRFGAIADAFFAKVSSIRDRAVGELVSALPLPPEKVAEIAQAVGHLLGKDVELQARVETRMLGGIIVRVGDTVLDGSVERQLEEVRRQLLA